VAEVRALRESLEDRFGKPPQEVVRLLRMTELRILASQRGLMRVETRGERVYLIRRDRQPVLLTGGRLPRLQGHTPDQHLATLIRMVGKLPGAPAQGRGRSSKVREF